MLEIKAGRVATKPLYLSFELKNRRRVRGATEVTIVSSAPQLSPETALRSLKYPGSNMKIESGWKNVYAVVSAKSAMLQSKYEKGAREQEKQDKDGIVSGQPSSTSGGAGVDFDKHLTPKELDAREAIKNSDEFREVVHDFWLVQDLWKLAKKALGQGDAGGGVFAATDTASSTILQLMMSREANLGTFGQEMDFEEEMTPTHEEVKKVRACESLSDELRERVYVMFMCDIDGHPPSFRTYGALLSQPLNRRRRFLLIASLVVAVSFLSQDPYMVMVGKLNTLMVPPPIDEKETAKSCQEDWLRDSSRCKGHGVGVRYKAFLEAWFELADFWVEVRACESRSGELRKRVCVISTSLSRTSVRNRRSGEERSDKLIMGPRSEATILL